MISFQSEVSLSLAYTIFFENFTGEACHFFVIKAVVFIKALCYGSSQEEVTYSKRQLLKMRWLNESWLIYKHIVGEQKLQVGIVRRTIQLDPSDE